MIFILRVLQNSSGVKCHQNAFIILTGTVSPDNNRLSCMQHIHVHTSSGTSASPSQLFQAIPLPSVSSYQSEKVQGSQGSHIAGYYTKQTSLSLNTHIAQL